MVDVGLIVDGWWAGGVVRYVVIFVVPDVWTRFLLKNDFHSTFSALDHQAGVG